jgi:deoxyhypusine synthase
VQCIVTTAGGVEEDFIKCLAPFYCDDYRAIKGADLRRRGINRIGPNIGVPNLNYCAFQDWVVSTSDVLVTPSVNLSHSSGDPIIGTNLR